MTQKDVDRVLLVLYALREVGPGGSLEQATAVCYCLRNRVRAGWGDWADVIENAPAAGAHDAEAEPGTDFAGRVYQRLLRDVDDIYFGSGSLNPGERDLEATLCDPKRPCLYWAYVNRPMRKAFVDSIVRDPQNHANRATMGLMMFYE